MFGSQFRPAIAIAASLALGLCACDSAPKAPADIYEESVANPERSRDDRRADKRRLPADIMRFAGVQEGMQVIDLLGGAGYYTELLSHVVGPRGHVTLQNNSLFLRFSEEGLQDRLADGRLENVTRLDSEFADLKLPAETDLIFLVLSYHDIYVPRDDPVIMTSRDEFFPQIQAALKPGGKVLVVDHAAEPESGTSATAWYHRIAEDYAVADFESAGFRLLGRLEILRNPDDDYSLRIWNDKINGKTDRFVLLFEKT